MCKVGESMEDFKRCLTNSPEPWLLILDNADDPLLNISKFFPVGTRGTIIITSRNPECKCHATVGSKELHEMESHDAIDLLLKSAKLSIKDDDLRGHARPIVQTLGYLALAVSQAAASIRLRVCSLENYVDTFTHYRNVLLSRKSIQSSSDYRYTVYTTWGVSVDAIKDLAKDSTHNIAATALEFLTFFGFCHFDGITESIFRPAWDGFDQTEKYKWWASNQLGMIRDRQSSSWDSLRFNEAMGLLSSYSLIRFSGPDSPISLHPLVHSWIRDSLSEELRLQWWNVTLSTIALAADVRLSYDLRIQLRIHIRHCMDVRQIDDFLIEDDVRLDRLSILESLISIYSDHPWRDVLMITERGLEYSKKTLGDECYFTCQLSRRLARCFNALGECQKTWDLLHGMVEVSTRVGGPENQITFDIMDELAWANRLLGREQEAFELNEKLLAIWEKSPNQRDEVDYERTFGVAMAYINLGRYEDAIGLLERKLAKYKEYFGEEHYNVFICKWGLAYAYGESGQHQVALGIYQKALKGYQKALGEHDPGSLILLICTAIEYGHVGQPEKGIPLIIKALELGSKIGYHDDLKDWEQGLEWLQGLSAENASHVPKELPKSQKQPRPAVEETSGGKRSRFWQRFRRRIGESAVEEAESSKAALTRQRRN